jgi:hypothetical protein
MKTVGINIRVTLDEALIKELQKYYSLAEIKGLIADNGKALLKVIAADKASDDVYLEKPIH